MAAATWLFFSVSNFYLWDEMLHNLVEGLWDFKDPTLSRQSAPRWRYGRQFYTPATLYSPETLFFSFWYSFLLETEWTPGHSAAGRIR
jgi:hypothetical protein